MNPPQASDDDPLPVGKLMASLHDPAFQASIRDAEIIIGFDPTTGEEVGLFYGVAQLGRIKRRDTPEDAELFRVPVDPDTDDVEVLYAMVQSIKGACCYQFAK